jgi:hypothetical protein
MGAKYTLSIEIVKSGLGDYLIGRGEHVHIGLAAWARAMLTFPGRRTAGLRED